MQDINPFTEAHFRLECLKLAAEESDGMDGPEETVRAADVFSKFVLKGEVPKQEEDR